MVTRAMTVRGTKGGLVRGAHAPVVTLVVGVASALAIASTFVLLVVLVLAAAHAVIEAPSVRRRRARRAARKRHIARRAYREHRLDEARVCTAQLEQLSHIVDTVRGADVADPFDLEGLLDRYVELALARKQCLNALGAADRPRLEAKLALAQGALPQTSAVLERRLAHAHTLALQVRNLDDAIGDIAQLVRCYGEYSTMPEIESLLEVDLVTPVLEHLDATDAVEVVEPIEPAQNTVSVP
jgi:hypothetical protein